MDHRDISGKVKERLHFLYIVCHKSVVMGQFRNNCVIVSSENLQGRFSKSHFVKSLVYIQNIMQYLKLKSPLSLS